jgi:hypothetical protein
LLLLAAVESGVDGGSCIPGGQLADLPADLAVVIHEEHSS